MLKLILKNCWNTSLFKKSLRSNCKNLWKTNKHDFEFAWIVNSCLLCKLKMFVVQVILTLNLMPMSFSKFVISSLNFPLESSTGKYSPILVLNFVLIAINSLPCHFWIDVKKVKIKYIKQQILIIWKKYCFENQFGLNPIKKNLLKMKKSKEKGLNL